MSGLLLVFGGRQNDVMLPYLRLDATCPKSQVNVMSRVRVWVEGAQVPHVKCNLALISAWHITHVEDVHSSQSQLPITLTWCQTSCYDLLGQLFSSSSSQHMQGSFSGSDNLHQDGYFDGAVNHTGCVRSYVGIWYRVPFIPSRGEVRGKQKTVYFHMINLLTIKWQTL